MSHTFAQGVAKRVIYACDVGTTLTKPGKLPKFAWVRVEPGTGTEIVGSSNIRTLVTKIEKDLGCGYSIALGFEAPLFIPVPESADDLSRGRQGEGNRSFAAPPGAAVATLGVHQAAWVLREIFSSCSGMCTFTLDAQKWSSATSRPLLLCWEAFVAGTAHSKSEEQSHIQDAATAAMEFLDKEEHLMGANAVTAEQPFSLIGAAALWSGWKTDLQALHEQTLVIKPSKPCGRLINSVE